MLGRQVFFIILRLYTSIQLRQYVNIIKAIISHKDIKQMQALVSKMQVDKARQIVADFEKRGAKR